VSGELAFRLINVVVLPWWAVFLVAPRSRLARRAASHGAIFVALCALYGVLLIAALATGSGSDVGYQGMREALSSPLGFLAGWSHYLVFDLFIGAWILRESRRICVGPRPYLFFTWMVGPLGLGSFLIRRWLRLRRLGQIGESDLI
jgi:hypothetical protein